MPRKKYGFERPFFQALNGPCPFFIVKICGDKPVLFEQELQEELYSALGDGFKGLFSHYYLLEITRLIEKQLIPESAMFLHKDWKGRNLMVFCEHCFDSIRQLYEILTRQREGCRLELINFVLVYEALGVNFARAIAYFDVPCMVPGHPHGPGQLNAEQEIVGPVPLTTEAHELERVQGGLYSNLASERNFYTDWDVVEEVMQKLYNCSCKKELLDLLKDPLLENLKRHVEDMAGCVDSEGRILDQLRQSLEGHLLSICDRVNSENEDLLLEKVSENWDLFDTLVSQSTFIFSRVGPSFFASYIRLGCKLWDEYILQSPKLMTAIVIRARDGDQSPLMKELRKMLHSFRTVYWRFECKFLQVSEEFYENHSRWLRGYSTQSIVRMVNESIQNEVFHDWESYRKSVEELRAEEVKLAEFFLGDGGQLRLLSAFQKHYWTDQSEWLASCFSNSFNKEDFGLLARMKALLDTFPTGSSEFKSMLASHVAETVSLIMDGSDHALNGHHLLLTRCKYDRLINLMSEKPLELFLNISFRTAVNSNSNCSRCIVAYIDSKLREAVNLKISIDAETREAFKFTAKYLGSELFQLFYQYYLADRLMSTACSPSMEIRAAEILTLQFGSSFVDNMEHMLCDVKNSQKLMVEFRNKFPISMESPEVYFKVFDTHHWPLEQREPCNLPTGLRQVTEDFQSHYMSMEMHGRRKLLLQTHLGSATLKASFLEQQKDLIVSTAQMVVLMLFNSADSLTYSEIRDATGMSDADLKFCLHSLISVHDTGILSLKSHCEGEFSEKDMLFINEQFQGGPDLCPKHEFGTERLVEAVHEAADFHIDAAIARIMKRKQSLDHPTLLKEVTNALYPRFITTASAIKRRIERLTDDIQLLERDPEDPNCYRYIS